MQKHQQYEFPMPVFVMYSTYVFIFFSAFQNSLWIKNGQCLSWQMGQVFQDTP